MHFIDVNIYSAYKTTRKNDSWEKYNLKILIYYIESTRIIGCLHLTFSLRITNYFLTRNQPFPTAWIIKETTTTDVKYFLKASRVGK